MTKYIHYCWFGGKPLPKLAKKCIESWKKYLPDFEIIRWDEENVDLNECPFIKEAYEKKAWAFVADYTRTRALYEMGGIYFDTDMEVTKDITDILKKGSFLGVEDTGKVNSAVWYEEKEHGYLSGKLLKQYREFKGFNNENKGEIAIPKLITAILNENSFDPNSKEIQKLPHNIYIYPRDYFYPYSYNWENNVFTDNTCMIHYFDASWIPLRDRIEINLVRKIGRKKTIKILNTYRVGKDIIRKCIKKILFPVVIYRDYKRKMAKIDESYLKRVENTINEISKNKNREYIAFYNGEWLGVTSSCQELFKNTIDCGELLRKKDVKQIANAILNNNIHQVVFNAMSMTDMDIAISIKKKNPRIKIKSFWHGSHSQVLDHGGWERNLRIIKLHKLGIIDVMATCKKSLLEFYKDEGYKALFITNKVTSNVKAEKQNTDGIRIGLYAAKCDDWRKNMYSQMAAVSLIPNAILDMVPLNESAKSFAKVLGMKIDGIEKPLPRDELIKRMSRNNLNLYVTYSECAPMLPLESFEMNVPCLTGNNHHYFEGTLLEKYLVVNNEEDPEAIKEKIEECLKNKEIILDEYKTFKKKNLQEAEKEIKAFLDM